MKQEELIPHLFRTEYSKITSVLCKRFGFDHVEAAEDLASDTFLLATEVWGINGIPKNPAAWLYAVAKNKARNYLTRKANFSDHITPQLQRSLNEAAETEIDLSPQNISDSQLQMMFAICNPVISPEAQVGLALRILCGFGIGEIADAFLSNKETINKRLFRAKEKLREARVSISLPPAATLNQRVDAVLTTLYLLFNEGYYSQSQDTTLRKDCCMEAMRLAYLLTVNESTNLPAVNALLSLMCFHASRFDARKAPDGGTVLYEDQDTSLWDRDLIAKGYHYLIEASITSVLSKYHIEAAIAYWHTHTVNNDSKWDHILLLYNQLLQIEYSPIAALNRTFVLSKASGKQKALAEAEKLNLSGNHLYHTLLGYLHTGSNTAKALEHYQIARDLAKTMHDKDSINHKIAALRDAPPDKE